MGGCIVTSAEDFPEEQMVPPVILNTPELRQGDIITFDQTRDTDLRLTLTVSDPNVDQELRMRARLSVSGEKPRGYCQPDPIPLSGLAVRPAPLLLVPTELQAGTCTLVEVFVSEDFKVRCDSTDLTEFGVPEVENDLATAIYWVWEMSRDPNRNSEAARDIVTTCQPVPRASDSLPPPTP